jgi:hypothetical protein
MRIFSTVICCLFAGTIGAQQYVIKYDIQSQRANYFKVDRNDTAKIKNIDLKKNGRIMLQINNYNPFYWNARVTAFKTPVEEEVGYGDVFNPISALASGMGGMFGSLPNLDLPKSRGGEFVAEGMDNQTARYLGTAAKYAGNYEDLQLINAKLEELQVARLQLKELKYDINHTEAEIKASALATVKKALGTDQVDLATVLTIGKNYNGQLQSSLQEAGELVNSLQQQQKMVNPNAVYENKTLKEIGETAFNNFEKIGRLRSAATSNPNLMLDEVAAVAQLYKEISSASFRFSYAVKNEEDISDIKLELFPKHDSLSKDTLVQYFELSKRKALRIRNSVGVAFSYFDANNRNYFIGADSVIRKGGKDLFTPLLSTFIHFYAGKSSGIKWGGALGFGIPLQGEKKDVNFLLGLTAAIGKNEPILITLGAAGAKVEKLTNGYKLGDKTPETDPAKLTTSGYGIGGFLGVTFNLSNLNLGKK